MVRTTRAEISEIYNTLIRDLIYHAATVHRQHNDAPEVQVCTLLSVKTRGCPEDCAYCPQARYHTDVKVPKLMEVKEVIEKALEAKETGSTRFCRGAAWREMRDNRNFEKIVEMVKGVSNMGMEVCCTLGMLTSEQANKLNEASLYAYNHNLHTSTEFYGDVITTRTYKDRLETLENVRGAKISVCSRGIIGMGEGEKDRIGMLHPLATLPEHPESVPVNALVPVEGTPLEDQEKVSVWEMVRMIATARIIMPKAMVRLSARRVQMTLVEQELCVLAGANSMFAGDTLLPTRNPAVVQDQQMFQVLILKPG